MAGEGLAESVDAAVVGRGGEFYEGAIGVESGFLGSGEEDCVGCVGVEGYSVGDRGDDAVSEGCYGSEPPTGWVSLVSGR